jgi:hypothetical protein
MHPLGWTVCEERLDDITIARRHLAFRIIPETRD